MFGNCIPLRRAGDDVPEGQKRRVRTRDDGQRRELIVKLSTQQAEGQELRELMDFEDELSEAEVRHKEEVERLHEQREKEEAEEKRNAIREALMQGGGQIIGEGFGKLHALMSLHKAAKDAGDDERSSVSAQSHSKDADMLDVKLPMPEADSVVVKVTHPCKVSALSTKLCDLSGLPADRVRVVFLGQVLKAEGYIPAGSIDVGDDYDDDDELDEPAFLWLVDTDTLKDQGEGKDAPGDKKHNKQGLKKGKGKGKGAEKEGAGKESPPDGDKDAVPTTGGKVGATPDAGRKGKTRKEPPKKDAAVPEGEAEASDTHTQTSPAVERGARAKRKQGLPKEDADMPASDPEAAAGQHVQSAAGGRKDKEGRARSPNKKARAEGGNAREGQQAGSLMRPGSLTFTGLEAHGLLGSEKGRFSKAGALYVVLRCAGREARSTPQKGQDKGKAYSWDGQELELPVHAPGELKESVGVEVWIHNKGDSKPCDDMIIGRGHLPVEHLAKRQGPDREKTSEHKKATVDLVRELPKQPGKTKAAGTVALRVGYTPPKKQPAEIKGEENKDSKAAGGGGEEEEGPGGQQGRDGLQVLPAALGDDNCLTMQELGAAMSQELEHFNIATELEKIECSRYVSVLISQGFGQKGAFAHLTEEALVGHPMYIPRTGRQRILALAELIHHEMRLEQEKHTTAMEDVNENEALAEKWTMDGTNFYNTKADLDAAWTAAKQKEADESEEGTSKPIWAQPVERKPRSDAKAELYAGVEAAAVQEASQVLSRGKAGACCSKHMMQLQRSALDLIEGWVNDTMFQVDVWLDAEDRFKNGFLSRALVEQVVCDALLINSIRPHEADTGIILGACRVDLDGLQYDRGKLMRDLKELVRKKLCRRCRLPVP